MKVVTPQEASDLFHAGGEVAFMDVREAGQFGEAHPLFAIPLPFSVLESRVQKLVPRRDVPVLLLDAGDDISTRAAQCLAALGYTNLHIIAGGMPGWAAAGLGVYKGVNVPSKTLGELAEELWHPNMITPQELAQWANAKQDFSFFDARPPAEYQKMRVPGSVCLPNAELAHRAASLGVLEQAPLVITCAGRTRGIVGAIGMRIAGYGGPVMALENGTQGWALAGETLERGATAAPFPSLDAAAANASQQAADRIIAQFGLTEVTIEDAAALLRDQGRTSYLFDTRSALEAENDPVPGAVHAPSGQVTQATDQWIGTLRSRVVLCCDTGLRSALAGFWLKQLGYDVFVLRLTADRSALPNPAPDTQPPSLPTLTAQDALQALADGAVLVDLRGSMAFRKAHVAKAIWACRPGLAAALSGHEDRLVLLLADDVTQTAWVAQDLHKAGHARVMAVAGGMDALVHAGAPLVSSPDIPADERCIDHLFFVHDRHDGNLDASRRYLEWETGLVAQLSKAERAEYHLIAP
ncbi:rhodanese-like domain-containing protein [Roseinatronobacter sp.]|uniref:rhodanese-like domain-containing protein n=1 Tax=Roseinatronobacter sp. TaxID=1945755 RepID=UPI0025E1FAA9|nr:rhodanese-like domain-containing protein [Roseibaca sp.]